MPGFDRRGPLGEGPRTGGGFGLCGPGPVGRAAGAYGYPMRGAGRGFAPWGGGRGRVWGGGRGGAWGGGRGGGFGFGRGLGYRGHPWAAGYAWPWVGPGYGPGIYEGTSAEGELDFLRGTLSDMEKEMKAVQDRIKNLEAKNEK